VTRLWNPSGVIRRAGTLAGRVERVEVVVVRRAGGVGPADELHALLERGVALADEARLVQPDRGERAADRREGAFADADDADLGRLDERDARPATGGAQRLREKGRGEPAGGAAADDEDALDRCHGSCLLLRRIVRERTPGASSRIP